MEKLPSRSRKIPLYVQLEQMIKTKILTGGFSLGERIPTETELCRTYGVSKITVRQAILNLVNEGLLTRKQGKGTFTRKEAVVREASTFKFSGNINDFIQDGLKMKEVKILDLERLKAPAKVAQLLNLQDGEEVVQVRRIRNRANQPVSYIRNYLPAEIGRHIEKNDFLRYSMLQILRDRLGIPISNGIQYIEAIVADYEVASALSVNIFSPVLYSELVMFGRDGKPVEFAQHFFRPDQFRYTIELKV
jgi:GntR family transcriptional regulator